MTSLEQIAQIKCIIKSKFPKKIARKIIANIYKQGRFSQYLHYTNTTLPHSFVMNFSWWLSMEARSTRLHFTWSKYHSKLERRRL